MKITRYKRAQKHLLFYRNYFDFRPPYQIMLDATFCQAALKNKINLKEQIPKYLNDEVKLLTTVCVINEAEKLGHAIYGAMLIIKQFPVHKCGHEKNPISANDCLYSLIKRKDDHYFLATQDQQLTEKARLLSYVPILFIKMNTIILEQPAADAKTKAIESQKHFHQNDSHQFKTLKKLKKIELLDKPKNLKRKRKGPKGPNPLSCKKKKVSVSSTNKTDEDKSKQIVENIDNKKKRKRTKRIPNHIKRMFTKIEADLNLKQQQSSSSSSSSTS